MADPKYAATSLIWSYRHNREYKPGETLELDDANARVLFRKQCIQPAEYRQTISAEITQLTGVYYDGTDDE